MSPTKFVMQAIVAGTDGKDRIITKYKREDGTFYLYYWTYKNGKSFGAVNKIVNFSKLPKWATKEILSDVLGAL